MTEFATVYLLEAYKSSTDDALGLDEAFFAALRGSPGVRVIGLLDVPADEAVLCIVAADTELAAETVKEVAARHGTRARLLEARWSPVVTGAAEPDPAALGRSGTSG